MVTRRDFPVAGRRPAVAAIWDAYKPAQQHYELTCSCSRPTSIRKAFSDGGLGASTVVCSVVPRSGAPVFTDGPFAETKEHLGGFAVVDVPDDAGARYWAGRIAVAVGWPQEVHRFPHRIALSTDTQSGATS
jgi:YCII-related domain